MGEKNGLAQKKERNRFGIGRLWKEAKEIVVDWVKRETDCSVGSGVRLAIVNGREVEPRVKRRDWFGDKRVFNSFSLKKAEIRILFIEESVGDESSILSNICTIVPGGRD